MTDQTDDGPPTDATNPPTLIRHENHLTGDLPAGATNLPAGVLASWPLSGVSGSSDFGV